MASGTLRLQDSGEYETMQAPNRLNRLIGWALIAALTGVFAACGGSSAPTSPGDTMDDPDATPSSDFVLADVNPNSATFMTDVSPRQHLTRVSAWYFGHAT